MDYSQLAYPNHKTPLLQAYGGHFNAAFVTLHPFFRIPVSMDWNAVERSRPDNLFTRKHGQPIHWQTVMEGIGCEDLRHFYIGMRTSIGALKLEYQDKEMATLIAEYTEQLDIFYPVEGYFAPLLIEPVSQYISHEQTNEIVCLAEFEKEPEVLSVEAVLQECDFSYNLRGSLFDVNVTRLATVDWDDFFTVIYGPRKQLESLVESNPLEGFFCDQQTLHTWCWQSNPVKPAVSQVDGSGELRYLVKLLKIFACAYLGC